MSRNPAREKMMRGETVLGINSVLGSPAVALELARQGFDFVLVDGQHGQWEINTMEEAFRAILLGGSVPMARAAQNDFHAIGSVLDRGALGVVVPMVETGEQAEAAAWAARFPPRGRRSAGGIGATLYGGDYFETIDNDIFVAVQIETELGVANADAILGAEGIDGCWLGPTDLAFSLGLTTADFGKEGPHTEALNEVLAACERTGTVPGIAGAGPDGRWLADGFRFVTVSSDRHYVQQRAAADLERYGQYRV